MDANNLCAAKLFTSFRKSIDDLQIPIQNIITLSCDNAAVILANEKSFKNELRQLNTHFVTIGCPCLKAALIPEQACANLPVNLERQVRYLVNFIQKSPKR